MKKIKTIGKVCGILSKIMTVLMIIAASALVITGIVLVAIPDNMIAADVSGGAEFTVYGEWIDKIPQDQIDGISEQIEDGKLNININANMVNGVEQDGNAIVLHADAGSAHFTLRKLGFALLMYSLIPGALIAVFIMFGKMMKALREGDSPFTDGVVKGMTGFAISLIPYAVLKPTAAGVGTALLTSGDFEINFGVDLSTAFAALVIILLIMIFKYGVGIQKESDETL